MIFRPSFVFGRDGGILPHLPQAREADAGDADHRRRRRSGSSRSGSTTSPPTSRAAVDKPEAANRTFELGGPDAVSWNEFWERLKQALGVRRPSVHVPMGFMRLNALVTERLPGNIPLTRDLLKMLEAGDNVVSDTAARRDVRAPARAARRAAPPRRRLTDIS